MDWFYYIVGKLFIWGTGILVVLSIGYYLGYNHTSLPVIKDFSIVKNITPTPERESDILDSLVLEKDATEEASATPSATITSEKKTSQKPE